jgi:hypothetical protein
MLVVAHMRQIQGVHTDTVHHACRPSLRARPVMESLPSTLMARTLHGPGQ